MQLSRRSFLKGTLTLSAVTVLNIPEVAANIPILYGDGVHDDTRALQALFDRKKVIIENDLISAKMPYYLTGGTYLISDSIHIREGISVTRTTFIYTGKPVKSIIYLESYCSMYYCTVINEHYSNPKYKNCRGISVLNNLTFG